METKHITRYRNKSVPDLIKLATVHFNKFIRLRDSKDGYFTCISCNLTKSTDKMHAGHFFNAGQHGVVRFDENNVHGQCEHCNTFQHGNLLNYRNGLERKIGLVELAELEMKTRMRGFRWDRFSLIDIIITYQEKNKSFN